MDSILQFFTQNWASILFGLAIAGVIGWTYYLTRRTRSEYLSRTAMAAMGSGYNEDTLAIVRHIVGSIAGLLAMLGVFGQDMVEVISAIVIGIAIIIMSWNSLDKDSLTEKLSGVLRHVITFAGGVGIITGTQQEQSWLTWGGLIVTGIGILWSLFNKKEKLKVE